MKKYCSTAASHRLQWKVLWLMRRAQKPQVNCRLVIPHSPLSPQAWKTNACKDNLFEKKNFLHGKIIFLKKKFLPSKIHSIQKTWSRSSLMKIAFDVLLILFWSKIIINVACFVDSFLVGRKFYCYFL